MASGAYIWSWPVRNVRKLFGINVLELTVGKLI
jgi:hypothetical protein